MWAQEVWLYVPWCGTIYVQRWRGNSGWIHLGGSGLLARLPSARDAWPGCWERQELHAAHSGRQSAASEEKGMSEKCTRFICITFTYYFFSFEFTKKKTIKIFCDLGIFRGCTSQQFEDKGFEILLTAIPFHGACNMRIYLPFSGRKLNSTSCPLWFLEVLFILCSDMGMELLLMN